MAGPPRSLPLVAVVLAIGVLIGYARVVAGGSTWSDLTYHAEIAPPRLAAAAAIQGGALPAWWEGSALGVPLAGEPSHGAMYPAHWLAATPRALDLVVIGHLLWLALGVVVWARRTCSETAAIVVGLLVATSGLLASTALRGALPAIAHLPWLGLAATALVTDQARRARWTVVIGGALGAIALAGQLGVLVDALVIAIVLGGRRATWRWLAPGLVAGLAIGAAQWIPAIFALGTGAGATVTGIPFARLLELIIPGSFGALDPTRAVPAIAGTTAQLPSLFVGAPLFALAAVTAASRRRVALGVGLGGLALVVGRGGWPAIVSAPELHLAVLVIIIAAHAGAGVDALLAGERRAVLALAGGGLASIVAMVAIALLRARYPDQSSAMTRALVDAGLGLACLAGALALAWRSGKIARPDAATIGVPAVLIVALLVAPSLGSSPSIAPTASRAVVEEPSRWAELASDFPPPRRAYRPAFMHDPIAAFDEEIATFTGAVAARWGIAAARSEDPARPAIHDAVWHASAAEGGALLDRFGISLAILPSTVVGPRHMTELAQHGTWSLVELPVAPPAAVVHGVTFALAPADGLALLFPVAGGAGLPRGTIVVSGRGDSRVETTAPKPCAIRTWTDGDIALACTAERPGYAVVSSSASPGWEVTVDGAVAEPVVADVMRRAVAIPAGAHAIQWTYRAPGLGLGLAIAAGGLAALAVLGLLARRHKR